ncbi:hypothetical protein K4F52_006307 [Lecanicillium sp. MT-2017a]|nr:hypothetical protein K4F52_006307 [Lecanicillium sp. MT-2017a]
MKDRSHRLTAFVANNASRSQPGSPRKSGIDGLQEEKRPSSEQGQVDEVESFKVPVPKTARPGQLEIDAANDDDDNHSVQVADFAYQQPPDAQGHPPAHLQNALEGSELGDSFMNSRVSTPSNGSYESRLPYLQREGGDRRSSRVHGGTHIESSAPAFHVGDDLFMSVVDVPRRHAAAEMKDGFSTAMPPEYEDRVNHTPTRHSRHKPHQAKAAKLPLREVRMNRKQRPSDHETKHRGRGLSPNSENRSAASHSNSPVRSYSFDSGSYHEDEDLQSTPTGKPAKKSTGRSTATRNDDTKQALAGSPMQQSQQQSKRRRLNNLDYDDAALSSMRYQDLLDEPFDYDPASAAAAPSPAVSSNDDNAKMEQLRLAGPNAQQALFANMSVDEWESAGDWFAKEFAGLMHKLRETRRSKRDMIDEFEQEAAAREEAVRQRSDKIDRKLQKMREDGLRVVGERTGQRGEQI